MQGEWYAMQASGYSVMRACFFVVAFASALAACCLFVSHVAEPWGFRKIEKVVFEGAQKRWNNVLSQSLQAGVFETSMPQWMVYAGWLSEDRTHFREFMLAPQKIDSKQSVRLYAPKAKLKGQLENGDLSLDLFDGKFLRFQGGEQIVIDFEELSLPLGAMLKESFSKTTDAPRRKVQILSTPDLRRYIDRKKMELSEGKKSKRLTRAMTTLALRTGIGLTILPLSLFGILGGLVRRRSSRNNSYLWALGGLLVCFGSLAAIAPLQSIILLQSETLVCFVLGCVFLVAFGLCLERNKRVPKSA
jgi:lipopolysaccharide export LptBFGC system permease protein LptF